MKKKMIFSGLVCLMLLSASALMAQPPGARMSPEEMALREKQNLYKKITDLTEEQKMLLDGIYDEMGQSMKERFEEARQTRDREKMRSSMMALQEEKDGLVGDVLNDEQMVIYNQLVQDNKAQMEKRRQERQGSPR